MSAVSSLSFSVAVATEKTLIRTKRPFPLSLPLPSMLPDVQCRLCLGELFAFDGAFDEKIVQCISCTDQQTAVPNTPPPKLRRLAHNEHLVGVELHPGPQIVEITSGNKAVVLRQTKKKKKSRTRASRGNVRRSGLSPITSNYISMLCDPTSCPPIPSGFMTYTPTLVQTGYTRNSVSLVNDGALIILNPDAVLAQSTSTANNYLQNFVSYRPFNGTIGGTNVALPAVNRTSLIAAVNTQRTLAGGLRLVIEHASTASSGIISVARLNGITLTTALDTTTPDNVMSLPSAQIYSTLAGTCTIKMNWLPSDPADFEFASSLVYGNGAGIYNPVVVALSGFPVGTRVFFESATHLEGQAGFLSTGGVIVEEKTAAIQGTFQPALIDEYSSPDSFWRKSAQLIGSVSDAVAYSSDKVIQVQDAIGASSSFLDRMAVGVAQFGKAFSNFNGAKFLRNMATTGSMVTRGLTALP